MNFQVGDRVSRDDSSYILPAGSLGSVSEVSYNMFWVKWDNFIGKRTNDKEPGFVSSYDQNTTSVILVDYQDIIK